MSDNCILKIDETPYEVPHRVAMFIIGIANDLDDANTLIAEERGVEASPRISMSLKIEELCSPH